MGSAPCPSLSENVFAASREGMLNLKAHFKSRLKSDLEKSPGVQVSVPLRFVSMRGRDPSGSPEERPAELVGDELYLGLIGFARQAGFWIAEIRTLFQGSH